MLLGNRIIRILIKDKQVTKLIERVGSAHFRRDSLRHVDPRWWWGAIFLPITGGKAALIAELEMSDKEESFGAKVQF